MKPPIDLIALDFDGTILEYLPEGGERIHPHVIDVLNRAGDQGVRWCTNSGRLLESHLDIIGRALTEGLRHPPVALICVEGLIYLREGDQYVSDRGWNDALIEAGKRLEIEVERRLDPVIPSWHRRWGLRAYRTGETYAAVLLSQEASPDEFRPVFAEAIGDLPGMRLVRNDRWFMVVPYGMGKGNALDRLRQVKGIEAERTFAAGDHENDIPMLNGEPARHVGCPANATEKVRQTVLAAGGAVADSDAGAGVASLIRDLLI